MIVCVCCNKKRQYIPFLIPILLQQEFVNTIAVIILLYHSVPSHWLISLIEFKNKFVSRNSDDFSFRIKDSFIQSCNN